MDDAASWQRQAEPSLAEFRRLLIGLACRALTTLDEQIEELSPKDVLAALTAAAKLGEQLEKHAAHLSDAERGSAARQYADAFPNAPAHGTGIGMADDRDAAGVEVDPDDDYSLEDGPDAPR